MEPELLRLVVGADAEHARHDGGMRVGIVGGGQLARMMAIAAAPLGIEVRVLAERADDAVAGVVPDVHIGAPNDIEAMRRFADGCDVVTFDHELVDPDVLQKLEDEGVTFRPSVNAMRVARNKVQQRALFHSLGLISPEHIVTNDLDELRSFIDRHSGEAVLKAVTGGYDGRGVWECPEPDDVARIHSELTGQGVEVIAEERVMIEREISAVVARRPSAGTQVDQHGQIDGIVAYPVVRTVQRDGMCVEVLLPGAPDREASGRAASNAVAVAQTLDVSGILALEQFVSSDGRILVNELAIRPHNTAHWTIEGTETSQFENHLRGVLDLPLGRIDRIHLAVAMANVVGTDAGDPALRLSQVLGNPSVHPHLYGKAWRPGRKLGHVTVCGDDLEHIRQVALRAAATLSGIS